MNEQEDIFQAGDQAIRAGLMALGQVGERIAHKSAEKSRQSREADEGAAKVAERARVDAERIEREQARQLERAQLAGARGADVAIGVARDQVRRDGWWAGADGNRVATQFSLLQQLEADPRAADARDIMKGRIRELYGIDTDAIAAKHPTSHVDQHNALTNAIDDWRAAHREDAAAAVAGTDDVTLAPASGEQTPFEQARAWHEENFPDEHTAWELSYGHADTSDGRRSDESKLVRKWEAAQLDGSEEHKARADQLRQHSAAEQTNAAGFEAEQRQDYAADAAAARGAATPARKARVESATGYPRTAKQSLNEGRQNGAPKARVNRSRQVKPGNELTR